MKKTILTFTIYFSTTSVSHAYLDPGSGGLIIQAIIGGIAAVTTVASLYWQKFKKFFGIGKKKLKKKKIKTL
jgi:hypothetical protein